MPQTASVQSLLPPEPRSEPVTAAGSGAGDAVAASSEGELSELDPHSGILPGSRASVPIHELPVEKLSLLKTWGWSLPHLADRGYEPEKLETGVIEGVRTIQLQLVDDNYTMWVAETRAEEEGRTLDPIEEKVLKVLDPADFSAERLQLSTGDECTLYISESDDSWTAAMETDRAQYVISSDMPTAAASQIMSWVMLTDRSRVQTQPLAPSASERVGRGLEELFGWIP
ncbi:hypothetical protein GCM10009771_00460 [Nesterenkonia flava]